MTSVYLITTLAHTSGNRAEPQTKGHSGFFQLLIQEENMARKRRPTQKKKPPSLKVIRAHIRKVKKTLVEEAKDLEATLKQLSMIRCRGYQL